MVRLMKCCLTALLALLIAGSAPAASLGELPSGDALSQALASSRVKDRNAAIDYLEGEHSPQSTRLLQALLEGTLYVDNEGKIFLEEGESYKAADGSAALSTKQGLKRSATSNAQRKRLSLILTERNLASDDPKLRDKAVSALLELGAEVPPAELIEGLLQKEDEAHIYEKLKLLRAVALASRSDRGSQELIEAAAILENFGSAQCRQALLEMSQNADPKVQEAAAEALGTVEFHQKAAGFFENLFFGLSLGSVLVLAAIGLSITFGVMGVINMAHGEIIMIGAYCVVVMQRLLPESPAAALILAIPMSFIVTYLLGLVIERTVISRLYGRPLETLLATFGLSLILQQAVRTIFSPLNQAVICPDFLEGSIRITTNLSVTVSRLAIIFFSLTVFLSVLAIINHTRLGLEVRAVSQNRAIARALGINAARVDAHTFGLGSGVAGLAGAALSLISNVGPNLGQTYIIDTFMVVVLGGVGNLWGTLVGGTIMGLAMKFLEPLSGAMLSKIIILVIIILFIQKRPRGLFPQKGRAAEV